MRAYSKSFGQSTFPATFPGSKWTIISMLTALIGCTEAAGLEEHTHYLGFPDSLSVPCSNGLLTIECDKLETAAPQDGHTLNARPTYEISGSDVIDKITGLSWYRTPGDQRSHVPAVDYCDVLPGNYRLPTRIELASLLDFRAASLVRIDREMFPDVKPMKYWTASQYGDDVNAYWSVDFCSACLSEYPIISEHVSTSNGVLCVKSAGEPFQTGPFTVTGVENRFLRDGRTGLMWMKKSIDTRKDWVGSLNTCKDAPDGAYGDFRLPNMKELATLVDDSKVGPNNGTVHSPFDIAYNEIIWSSTPTPIPGKFFALNVTGGSIGTQKGEYTYIRTLCVRGPD